MVGKMISMKVRNTHKKYRRKKGSQILNYERIPVAK
jgi:hypothetical protein